MKHFRRRKSSSAHFTKLVVILSDPTGRWAAVPLKHGSIVLHEARKLNDQIEKKDPAFCSIVLGTQ
jgi:hypothetical protein